MRASLYAATAPPPLSLRVVHVTQQLKSGGAETLLRGLCAGLTATGIDASVVSVYDDALTASEREALGFPSRSVGRHGRGDVAFFPRLVALLRTLRPDVVHAHLHAGKYAGRFAALAARVPAIVFTEHGDEAGGAVRAAVNRFLDPRTTRFVTFSETQRAALALRAGISVDRVAVIPNGIAEPPRADRRRLRAELGLADDSLALFMPARFSEQKNQALALRAFATLAAERPAWRMFFAGKGPLEDAMRALAAELGIATRTVFLGFRDDAPLLGRAMDAFVMPSLWERMPLALGEAMRAELPVVTTPWDGVVDFVRDGETGIVASNFSVEAFARALRTLSDAETRVRISRAAHAFADERFDLGQSVRGHVELYRSICAAPR